MRTMFKRVVPMVIRVVRVQCRKPLEFYSAPFLLPTTTSATRFYASKDKKDKKSAQQKGGKGGKLIDVANENFSELFDVDSYKNKLQAEIDRLRDEFILNYSLRTNMLAFEQLPVRLPEGTKHLSHLATLTLKTPQLLVIQVTKSDFMKNIQEALQKSSLNVNPQVSGLFINVPLPKLTREYREQMVQKAKGSFEMSKKRLNSIKDKVQKTFDAKSFENKSINQDLLFKAQKYTEHLVREYSAQAEEMMKTKQKELVEELHS